MTKTTAIGANRKSYNIEYFSHLSDESILAMHERAASAVKADIGKRYRGYKLEAQNQRIRQLHMMVEVVSDRGIEASK